MKNILLLILVLSVPLFAQHVHPSPNAGTITMNATHENNTNTYKLVSQLGSCTNSGTLSCFHMIPGGSYPVTQISAAADGSLTLAMSNVDNPNSVYRFDPTSNQPFLYQPQYGTGAVKLAVGDSSHVMALGLTNTWGCNSPTMPTFLWGGSNGWVSEGACLTDLAAAPFNYGSTFLPAYGVDSSNNVRLWWNGSTYWSTLPAVPGTGTVHIGVSPDGHQVAAVRNGIVYISALTTSWSAWASVGANIGATQVTWAQDPLLGSVIYASYPKSGNQIGIEVYANGQWNSFNNDATYGPMSANGQQAFSTNSAGTMMWYSTIAYSWTHSYTVHTTCNPSPCPGTVHTYQSTLQALGRTAHVVSTAPANVTPDPKVTANMIIDPFGAPGGGDGSNDVGNCPIAGLLFDLGSSSAFTLQIETCKGEYTKQGPGTNCGRDLGVGPITCDYNVAPYCTPETTPPDAWPLDGKQHGILEYWGDTAWGFFDEGVCERLAIVSGVDVTGIGPWYTQAFGIPLFPPQGPPYVCTHNPD